MKTENMELEDYRTLRDKIITSLYRSGYKVLEIKAKFALDEGVIRRIVGAPKENVVHRVHQVLAIDKEGWGPI